LFAKSALAEKTKLTFDGDNLKIALCSKHGVVCDWTLFDSNVGVQRPLLSELESCGIFGETGVYQQPIVKNKATMLIPIADRGNSFCRKKDGTMLWLSSDKARVKWKLNKSQIFNFQKPTPENGYKTAWNNYRWPKLEFVGEELRLTVYSDFMAVYGQSGIETTIPENIRFFFQSNIVGWTPGVAASNFIVSNVDPDDPKWTTEGYGNFSFPKNMIPSQDTGIIRFEELVLPLDKLEVVGPNLHIVVDGNTGFLWLRIGN
jgi:hypothetical protein